MVIKIQPKMNFWSGLRFGLHLHRVQRMNMADEMAFRFFFDEGGVRRRCGFGIAGRNHRLKPNFVAEMPSDFDNF
jgi:hypothetical protein